MRTAQGEASKHDSDHYERRSRGAFKEVRVPQRGRTHPEQKGREEGGYERGASRRSADPCIGDGAD
jgi:hypothetical protein